MGIKYICYTCRIYFAIFLKTQPASNINMQNKQLKFMTTRFAASLSAQQKAFWKMKYSTATGNQRAGAN